MKSLEFKKFQVSPKESLRTGWKSSFLFVIRSLCTLYLILSTSHSFSQNPDPLKLLDKALGGALGQNNMSITFEGIAYSQQDPVAIFNLPVYEVIRGGYVYVDGKKYEMKLGSMKAISDGQIMVVADEVSKTLYIDSLRTLPADSVVPLVERLVSENFGEGNLSYIGKEKVNGKMCHKIKSSFSNQFNTHVYYWIEVATDKLYLMAEWQNVGYDIYWFNNIGKAPSNYDYSVNLPNTELDTYYGYNVIDNRFINEIAK